MSILGFLGSRASAGFPIASALFGGGRRNSTPQEDWDRAVAQGSVAKYFPKGPPPGIVVAPGAGAIPATVAVTPQVPYIPTPALPAVQQASIASAALPALGNVLRTIPTMLPRIGGAATQAVGRVTAALPAGMRAALPRFSRALAVASGYVVVGGLVYDTAGNLIGRTRRRKRMNPLNYRAAKRAARRLCAVQDLCADITAALPVRTQRVSRRRYRRRKKCR